MEARQSEITTIVFTDAEMLQVLLDAAGVPADGVLRGANGYSFDRQPELGGYVLTVTRLLDQAQVARASVSELGEAAAVKSTVVEG